MSETENEPESGEAAAPSGEPAGAPPPPPPASAEEGAQEPPAPAPEERVAKLEAEKEDLRNRMLRIAADFDNWKKRARKEQADAEQRAREAVLRDMLEIVDNLERATGAFGGAVDAASVAQGVSLVLRLFHSKLERYDVRAFESKGQPFDPRLHEAISQVPAAGVAPGAVVSEMQRGYRVGERLLRPAVVAVALPPRQEVQADAGSGAAGEGEAGEVGGAAGAAGGGDGQSA